MLTAAVGGFITNTRNNKTPLLQFLDNLKLTWKKGTKEYSRIVFLDTRLTQDSVTGNQIHLELFGRERYLEKMLIPGHWFFISVKELFKIIISYYNTHRGTSQPELLYENNGTSYLDFPDYPLGTFDFGESTDILTAIKRLIAWLNLPVPAGGAGTLHSIIFEDHPTDETKMYIKIFEQGSTLSSPDTLGVTDKQTSLMRTNETYTSNLTVIKGQSESGTMPPNIAQWTSKIEEYDTFPVWSSTISYTTGVHVNWKGIIYKCIVSTTPGITPASIFNWTVVTKSEYIGTSFSYSPYTKMKAIPVKNFTMNDGTTPLDTNIGSPAFVDSNLIIRDSSTWQDECIMRISKLSDIDEEYLYPATTANSTIASRVYEGMKFLIDSTKGTIEAPFTGNDKYGKAFENSLVQMDRDGDWIVIRVHERFDFVAVRSESRMYQYNAVFPAHSFSGTRKAGVYTPSQLGWRDVSEMPRANHCFHYPTSIDNVDGLVEPLPGGTQHTNSAIRVIYAFSQTSNWQKVFKDLFNNILDFNLPSAIRDLLWNKDIYNYGWWATLFEAPYPTSTYFPISENVGELYGGDADSKVPVLDSNNLNYTPSGKTGYDSIDSNYLTKLYGTKHRFNFDITFNDSRRYGRGDIPFRSTIYDIEGNVWIYDYTVRHLGDSQDITLPFSGYKIYRARAPNGWITTLENIRKPELLKLEVFEERKIKRMIIQMQTSYDEDGRFDEVGSYEWYESLSQTAYSEIKHIGIWDAFCFIKTPIVIKKGSQTATHHLTDKIQEFPSVSNVEQLDKIAQAQLELNLHKNDVFTIKRAGLHLDNFPGESFYIKNKYSVETAEKPIPNESNEPNTRKVSTISINYTDTIEHGVVEEVEAIKRI